MKKKGRQKKFRRGSFGVAQSPKQSSGGTDVMLPATARIAIEFLKKKGKIPKDPFALRRRPFGEGSRPRSPRRSLLCLCPTFMMHGPFGRDYPFFPNDSDCQVRVGLRMIEEVGPAVAGCKRFARGTRGPHSAAGETEPYASRRGVCQGLRKRTSLNTSGAMRCGKEFVSGVRAATGNETAGRKRNHRPHGHPAPTLGLPMG
jgi:hypothetical protein